LSVSKFENFETEAAKEIREEIGGYYGMTDMRRMKQGTLMVENKS